MRHRPSLLLSILGCASALLTACWGNTTTVFPKGLEPLEDNSAPSVTDVGALAFKKGESAKYQWAHGRGRLKAEPSHVWATLKDANLMSLSCDTNDRRVQVQEDPAYELAYLAHYAVHDFITVEWDEQWRFGTIDGTPAAPSLSMVRYQKVYGSVLIDLMEGSLEASAVEDAPALTELAFVEHLSAAGGGADDIERGIRFRFASIQAALEQQEQPACP